MGGLSIWHWLILLVIVMVLFGRGRISETMGDLGKGIKSFKQGMNDEDKPVSPPPPPQIPPQPSAQAPAEGERTGAGDSKS